jgi:hypothetical protein
MSFSTHGTGTKPYAADVAVAGVVTGQTIMAERIDSTTSITPAENDWTHLRTNANGSLWVAQDGGGGGTQYAEDASHSSGATGTLALVIRNDSLAALAGTDGDYSGLQVNAAGALYVDGSDHTQPVSGTITANLSATDNAVLDSIATAVQLIDNAISGSEMQIDVVGSLPAGSAAIGKLAANSGVDIGDVDVTSISAGSNLVGDVGLSGARTSGGSTMYKNLDVDQTEDAIKGSAGQIYWMHAMNMSASPLFLKFYNATVGNVTVGTTVPNLTFPVPTLATTNGAGFMIPIPNGIAFGTAITVACTTGFADNDSGAPGANVMILNVGYA